MKTATHDSPAWGTRANFIIRSDLSTHGMPGRFEQLWAKEVGKFEFEICCIPFFSYGLFLGDIVVTDNEYLIQRVITSNGHQTIRVAISDPERIDSVHELLHAWAEDQQELYEWCGKGYLAMDVPPCRLDGIDFDFLETHCDAGEIEYEVDE